MWQVALTDTCMGSYENTEHLIQAEGKGGVVKAGSLQVG